jgi:protoheme IX farnesyltransferase
MKTHRLALAAVAATFLLLMIGGLVHPTGSSLACPDWPLCYGQLFPKMEGGILYEHSHRLAATAVGLLTIGLALALRRDGSLPKRVRRLGIAAVLLVVLQGVLGGLTVIFKLPLLVSTAHLATSMLFFSLLVFIAFESRPRPVGDLPRAKPIAALSGLSMLAAGAVWLQIVLGAFVRHTSAGLACGTDILFCNGSLWPAGAASHLGKVQMLHRFGAWSVAAIVTAVAVVWKRRADEAGREGLSAWILAGPALVVGQIVLGMMTVLSKIDLLVVESHLALGALLLAHQLVLLFIAWRERRMLADTVAARAEANRRSPGEDGIDVSSTPEQRVSTSGSSSPLRSGEATGDGGGRVTGRAASSAPPHGRLGSLVRAVVELGKPRITGLVVFTTGSGLLIAPGKIGLVRSLVLLFSTSLLVASANTLNCWLEKDVDARMARTRNRPLPTARISSRTAFLAGLAEALLAIPALLFAANPLTAILGAFALVSYVFVYTPLKRVTPLALVVGAVPGAIPPVMGWSAVTGRLDPPAWVLFGILFLWQIPHFIAISLFLKDDYARGGLRVLPLVRGDETARSHLLGWTLALVPVSILMVPLGIAGTTYLLTALLLGGGFLAFAFRGLAAGADLRWARKTFAYSLVYLTILVGVLVAGAGCRTAPPPLPVLGTVPEAHLVAETGRPFTTSSLRGKPWVASFVFTRCVSICPRIGRALTEVQAESAKRGLGLAIVSISVDPEFDTPERMAAWGRRFGANPSTWTLLTGSDVAINQAVVQGFKLPIGTPEKQADGSFEILHSGRLVLVDGERRIRAYHDSDEEGVRDLLADAERLRKEGGR